MNKTLKCIIVIISAISVLCILTFAETVENISLTSDGAEIALSAAADGALATVDVAALNRLNVELGALNAESVSAVIVPVKDGGAAALSAQNVVYAAQKPTTDGAAEFVFRMKQSASSGIYALLVGGADSGYITRYFRAKNRNIPFDTVEGQRVEYDTYKNTLPVSLKVTDAEGFKEWTEQKDKITVSVTNGKTSVKVPQNGFSVDAESGILTVKSDICRELLPSFGDSSIGNTTDISVIISTHGVWNGAECDIIKECGIRLITPELSSEGFARGVDFDFTLYSDENMDGVIPIVTLYDGGTLVYCAKSEETVLSAGEEKNVTVRLKSADIAPSGYFTVKAMLWQGTDIKPIVTVVNFP